MSFLEDWLTYWASLSVSKWLTAGYVLALIVVVIGSNYFLGYFVASKPEGRKTALGMKCLIAENSALPNQSSHQGIYKQTYAG